MNEMGMTDKQFVGFLRFLLDSLKDVADESNAEKKEEKLNKVIENVQKTIEN